MKQLKYIRYTALAAVLGVCFLSTPLQASGLKGNDRTRVRISKVNWLKNLKELRFTRDNDWCQPKPPPSVPEPSSLLGGLAAGAGLCGLGLYQRRRSRS